MHSRHKLQLEKRHHDNQKKTGNPQNKPQPIRNPMTKCLTKVKKELDHNLKIHEKNSRRSGVSHRLWITMFFLQDIFPVEKTGRFRITVLHTASSLHRSAAASKTPYAFRGDTHEVSYTPKNKHGT